MKKFTMKEYTKIEHLMPKARKPQVVSNYQFLCALLYIILNVIKMSLEISKYTYFYRVINLKLLANAVF